MKKFIKKHKFRLQIIMMWFRFILANAAFMIVMLIITLASAFILGENLLFAAKFGIALILLAYVSLSDVLFHLPLKSMNNLEFVDNNEDNMSNLLPLKSLLVDIQTKIILEEKLYGCVGLGTLVEKAKLEHEISKLEGFG